MNVSLEEMDLKFQKFQEKYGKDAGKTFNVNYWFHLINNLLIRHNYIHTKEMIFMHPYSTLPQKDEAAYAE